MRGSRRASLALALVGSPLLPPAIQWEGGWAGSWLLGTSVTQLPPPSRRFEWQGPLALRSQLCSLSLPLPWSTPLPQWSVIRVRALARLGALPRAALPELPFHVIGGLGKGDVVPAGGLVSLHDPFLVLWMRALSPGPFMLPLCLRAVSSIPVTVFGLLPGPSGSLALLE